MRCTNVDMKILYECFKSVCTNSVIWGRDNYKESQILGGLAHEDKFHMFTHTNHIYDIKAN